MNLGFELATDYTLMITPAKWQTAEADQKIVSKMTYGQFREKLVPHMREVVFYPDCLDVFGIQESSGIVYFLLSKQSVYTKCLVINKSNLQKFANSRVYRSILNRETLWNIGDEIIGYIKSENNFQFDSIGVRSEYTINVNTQMTKSTGTSGVWDWEHSKIKEESIGKGGVLFGKDGKLVFTGGPKFLKKADTSSSNTSKDIFTSDNLSECESFYSWFDTKFTRFFAVINISSLTVINNNTFRFVPAPMVLDEHGNRVPGKFDHIYTDEELYRTWNLPQKYIDVIEAVIKERK